jgi:FixJ family two-component response regulator
MGDGGEAAVKQHRGQVTRKMQADSIADLVRMAGRLRGIPFLPGADTS